MLVRDLSDEERLADEREYERLHGLVEPPVDLLGQPRTNGGHAVPVTEEAGASPAHVIRVSDVESKRVSWLWQDYLPAGKLVVIDGDPALNKSTMTLDFAARITTGTPWPDKSPMPTIGNVVLLTAEDGIDDTVRPRLEAHGANLARVVVFDSVVTVDDEGEPIERMPSIPGDLALLEEIIVNEGAALAVIDPLAAFLNGRVDSHRDQDVRGALAPLAKLAERTGATIVVVRHLSKSGGANPLYRGGGSIGIIGAARAAMLVAPDPEDDSRRILACTKSNLGPMPSALAYRVVSDEEHGCARIVWEGATSHRAADLLAIPGAREDEAEDACAVLAQVLDDGAVWVKDALERMAAAGFSKDQAKRAKGKLRVVSLKVGAPGDDVAGWKWQLPRVRDTTEESEECSTPSATPFAPLAVDAHPSVDHDHARAVEGLDL